MILFAIRHTLESTLFCVLLFSCAGCFKGGAATRHAIGLVGVSKFAIPSLLLASTGARLSFIWPAPSWLSFLFNKISTVLTEVEGMLPTIVAGATLRALALFWAVGTVFMIGVWCIRLTRHKPRLTAATRQEEAAMAEAIAVLPVRLEVRLRRSDVLEEPALRGIWRPTVTIPPGLSEDLGASEFRTVLLHELAHARRLDNLAAALVHCLACVFWFHPLLWTIERRLNTERERACDQLVLSCGVRPQVYASGILKVCRFHVLGTTTAGVSGMSAWDVERRLELILQPRSSGSLSYVSRLSVAALALLMTVAPLAGGYCSQCISNGEQMTVSHSISKR